MPTNQRRRTRLELRSLFLPTASAEAAVFAACVPLLSTPTRQERAPSTSPARSGSPSSPSPFSPASARNAREEHDDVPICEAKAETPAMPSGAHAPLFAMLSGRVDATMVVLRTREVMFFGLRDGKLGPKELHRIRPTPTVTKDGAPTTSNAASAFATCAAVIPLDISMLCAAQSRRTGEAVYLRGVVGASDGRVSVFSESGYAFGFTAHTGPVRRVEPVYLDFPNAQLAELDAQTQRPPTEDGAGASLYRVTAHLGFVTAGEDNRVFLWCRQAGAMQLTPRALTESNVSDEFVSVRAFTVLQPRLSQHVVCAAGSVAAPLPAQLIYTSRQAHPVGIWSLPISRHARAESGGSARRRSASPASSTSMASVLRALPTSAVDPREVTAVAVSAAGTLGLVACGASLYRVDFTASATASSHQSSHDRRTEMRSSPVKLPVPCASTITDIVIQGRLVLAVCGEAGLIHILALGDTPTSVAWLGRYVTYDQRRVRSVTLHARACLMTVVDGVAGSVELVKLPDACLGPLLQDEDTVGPESIFASASALRHKCIAESLVAGTGASASTAVASLNALYPTAIERELEAELLARLIVPSQCNQYLHPSRAVL